MSRQFSIVPTICIAALLLVTRDVSAQVPADSLRGKLLDFAAAFGENPVGPALVAVFGNVMALEVSTAPTGSSTAGLTFTFDSSLGTFTRSSRTFGPAFAERSLTGGKGKFSAGFNWFHSHYDSLAGLDLTNGELRTSRNVHVTGDPVSYAPLIVNASSDTVVAFASVGVSDDLDIGVSIPWIRIGMDADITAFSASGVDLLPGAHGILNPIEASGVGDVALFGKYHFWKKDEGGLAGYAEVRLPTGSEDDFRGLGIIRTLVSAIWSRGGRIAPHVNVGYEVWSKNVDIAPSQGIYAKNQFKYAAGVEVEAHPRATLLFTVLGRRLIKGGQLAYETFQLGQGNSLEALTAVSQGTNVFSLAPGIKWNAFGTLLVTGQVLTSVENKGLRANVTPVVGLVWAF